MRTWQPIVFANPVVGKNFFLFEAIARTPDVRSSLEQNPVLASLTRSRVAALAHAAESCGPVADCLAGAFEWSDADIAAAERELRGLAAGGPVARFVAADLRPSGLFENEQPTSDADLIASAWRDAAAALNRIVRVYALGEAPFYPAIDSVSYDAKSASYQRLLEVMATVMSEQRQTFNVFYAPSLNFAARLLDANRRDEAGRFEPLHLGENAAAYRRIASIDWRSYDYSAVLVPGSGSEIPNVPLSPWGKLRVELGAARFKAGRAPFVIVSGGYVHPSQTPYAEAIEMKRSLMKEFGVPEDAILVDPHARHTTTNLRNAARLVLRYGLPADKPLLVTSDQGQSAMIGSDAFRERCLRELGYVPGEIGRRLSRFDLEFLPRPRALHADARDPLDP